MAETQLSIRQTSNAIGMSRQAIINGNFDIAQRGTSFVSGANNDDVYTLDRWNLISDGNDVFDVSQEAITDLPGSNYALKLDVETSARGGVVQILEAKDAQKFQGKTVSVSFAVKSANVSAIRGAVLSWDSTADSVTSDVVGTWGDTPTWATNWTQENTPSDLTVTSSWTTVTIEGISVDTSGMNNLALAIWLPNAETIGDIIYISQVQLNEGPKSIPFMPKSYAEELRACQRYFIAYGGDSDRDIFGWGSAKNTTDGFVNVKFFQKMRTVPTMSYSSLSHLAIADGAGSLGSPTALVQQSLTDSASGLDLQWTVASGATQYRPYFLRANDSASARIYFDAEL